MIKAASDHIGKNLWLWTVVGLVVAAAAAMARSSLGKGYHLGDLTALSAMCAGILMIVISQKGLPRPSEAEETD